MSKFNLIIGIILLCLYSYRVIDERPIKGGMKEKEKEEVLYTNNKKKKKKKRSS
jgi:hypothetical protein